MNDRNQSSTPPPQREKRTARDSAVAFAFVHINKTAGSSVERALGVRFRHRTAEELIAEMGIEAWKGKFTFTVVRNPWDKVVSHYAYRVMTNQTGLGERPMEFNEWVKEAYGKNNPDYYDKPRMFMPQLDWISDSAGRVLVDYVARFENLETDFAYICRRLGREAALPHVKRSRRKDFRTYYNEEGIAVVREWFQRDIEYFGYEFGKK